VITWKVIAQNTNTNTRASVTNTASKSSAGTKPLALYHPATKTSSPPHTTRAPPPYRHIHRDAANFVGT